MTRGAPADGPSRDKRAVLYRMVMPKHICPFGLKAKDLLEREGFTVEDRHLTTRAETDAFRAQHAVEATPQVFIGNERVGGYDSLRTYLGEPVRDPDAVTYKPIIAVFGVAALMALAASWSAFGTPLTVRAAEWFIAFSMCVLAILKLRDLEGFSNMFLGYDLLAQRVVRYAYVYPFAEALAGILMIAGLLKWMAIPVALFIGGIGAISVFKAVYLDKREVKCACVGGDSNVPLGFISLTLDHVFFSQTRTWMALVMGAVMAVTMVGFMWSMYKNRRVNAAIIAGSIIVFAGSLWLVRSQETVDDVSYMKAMIPHHSIAIMTSERAHIRDPRVRKLADGIIEAQVREIGEMKKLIADLRSNPPPAGAPDLLPNTSNR